MTIISEELKSKLEETAKMAKADNFKHNLPFSIASKKIAANEQILEFKDGKKLHVALKEGKIAVKNVMSM